MAGPSRDLNRVQRIADEHRATGHVLDVEAIEAADEAARPVDPGSARQYRARARSRAERIVAHLGSMRAFGEVEWTAPPMGAAQPGRDYVAERRRARERRERERAERLVRIANEVRGA